MLVLHTFGTSFHPDRRAGVGCRAHGATCCQASRAVGGRLRAGGDSGDLGGSCGKGQLVARPPTPLGCSCFAAKLKFYWDKVGRGEACAEVSHPALAGLCARGGEASETILAWTHLHGS